MRERNTVIGGRLGAAAGAGVTDGSVAGTVGAPRSAASSANQISH